MNLPKVVEEFGVGVVNAIEPIVTGYMNRNWRVATDHGAFVLKQILDVDADQARRQHTLMARLTGCGVPVPTVVTLPDGDTVMERSGARFALVAWVTAVIEKACTSISHAATSSVRCLPSCITSLPEPWLPLRNPCVCVRKIRRKPSTRSIITST